MRRVHPLCVVGIALALVTSCTQPEGNRSAAPSGSEPSSAAGTTRATGTSTAADGAEGLPRPAHVMVAIFENEDLSAIVGSAEAPYLTELAASGANFTDAHGETHPSQPNYLALFSGSTQGVTDDSCPRQLTSDEPGRPAAGRGRDVRRVLGGPALAGLHRVPERQVRAQAQPVGQLPAISRPRSTSRSARCPPTSPTCPRSPSSSPNLCNDMHDCGVAPATPGPGSTSRPTSSGRRTHNSLLIVTFDEDSGGPENHIATIVAGAGVRAMSSGQHINHYDLLRTLEDMYGLPPLGEAAGASALTGIWTPP